MNSSLIFFCLSFIREVLPLDKMFLDVVDYIFFIKHYQPMPLRWLIIDTWGNVTVISYSAVCTEEAVFRTLESIAGNQTEINLFKLDLWNFCVENGFDLKSSLLIKIFGALSFLSTIKKPKFDYNKRLVFPERKAQALYYINAIKQLARYITLLIYSDREIIKKDEHKFKFFRFIFLRNIRKKYSTGILYEKNFYKFYNGWFS